MFPRAFNEVETLIKNGYDVGIIAFDESGRLRAHECIYGKAKITRVKPAFWINFGVWNVFDFFPAFITLFSLSLKKRADVYHCYDIVSLVVGFLMKMFGKKLIYDAYENWPELVSNSPNFRKVSKFTLFLTAFVEQILARFADYIITIPTENDYLKKKFQKINHNVIVLPNFPKLKFSVNYEKRRELKRKYQENDIVFYAGAISKEMGILKSIEASNLVRKRHPNVKLLIAGAPRLPFENSQDKNEALKYIDAQGLHNNVEFIGWIPSDELLDYLSIAKMGLALYQPEKWIIKQSKASSKLFIYMLSSVPIIICNFSVGEIVRELDCGLLVNPADPIEIADAINYLLENPTESKRMGENGKTAIFEKHNWNLVERRLLKAYNKLAKVKT